MDTEKICRTCLGLTGPFLSIFDGGSGSSSGEAGCISDMLRSFTKTKPRSADNLPEKVCLTCISEINRCYSFKLKCEHSNRTLRQLLPDALPEEPDEPASSPPIAAAVPKLHKAMQTMPEHVKKTVSQEVQTIKEPAIEKVDATTSPPAKLQRQAQSSALAKPAVVVPELQSKTAAVKVFVTEQTDDVDDDSEPVDEADFYEITAELDNVDNEVTLSNEPKSNDKGKSIILHVSKGEGKYTEMIYDESTGELHAQDEEKPNKSAAEFKFTIINNENGEAEIETRAVSTRNSKRKAAATIAAEEAQKVVPSGAASAIEPVIKKPRVKQLATPSKAASPEKSLNVDAIAIAADPKKRREVRVRKSDSAADASTMVANAAKLNYFCERCNAGFAMHKSLVIHKRHNNCTMKCFKCEVCARVFVSSAHLIEHQSTHEQHSCAECSQSFESEKKLSQHMIERHHRSQRNQCNICQKVFTMLSTLRDHMRIHTGEKPFVCIICQKSFTQNANLRQHMFRHSNTKRFNCDQCQSGFVTKAELVSHKRSHTGDKPFQCDVCTTKFTTSSSLIKHKRKHTGERPYACEMCPMRFTSLNVLKNHRRTHTGEKPFACPHCPRRFTQNGDCVMHQRSHQSQDKIYLCPVCGDEFKNMQEMRLHLTEHTRKDKSLRFTLLNSSKENVGAETENTTRTSGRLKTEEEQEFIQMTMEDIC